MYPEDRVLIGVVRRRRDFAYARDAGWYRIPAARLPYDLGTAYLGLYLSGALGEAGAVRWYARVQGVELHRRIDLLPGEPRHPRALQLYYRLSLSPLCEKSPPILNPSNRPISFIFTTWDRFLDAAQISDLYRLDERYVQRLDR